MPFPCPFCRQSGGNRGSSRAAHSPPRTCASPVRCVPGGRGAPLSLPDGWGSGSFRSQLCPRLAPSGAARRLGWVGRFPGTLCCVKGLVSVVHNAAFEVCSLSCAFRPTSRSCPPSYQLYVNPCLRRGLAAFRRCSFSVAFSFSLSFFLRFEALLFGLYATSERGCLTACCFSSFFFLPFSNLEYLDGVLRIAPSGSPLARPALLCGGAGAPLRSATRGRRRMEFDYALHYEGHR